MDKVTKIDIPVIYHGEDKWLLLNHLGNSGKLRAAFISKPVQVADSDSHHCNEVSAKTSIRYHPKKWVIN